MADLFDTTYKQTNKQTYINKSMQRPWLRLWFVKIAPILF